MAKKEKIVKRQEQAKYSDEGIVRVVEMDVSADLPLNRALYKLKGVGPRFNALIARVFQRKKKVKEDTPIGKLSEKQLEDFEDIIRNPEKYGIHKWLLNKPEDLWDAKAKHLLASDLLFNEKEEMDRLGKMKHRRAIRRYRGLPVRGQKTKAGFRKGKQLGVIRKK